MAQVRVRKRGKTFSYIFEAGIAAYNDFLHGNIGITSESIPLADFMTAWLSNVVALNVKATSLQNPAAYIKVPKNMPRNLIKRHIITP